MGIDNVDFARVAWFRSDLFPVHPYRYLDALGLFDGQGVLIPSGFAEKQQLKEGDVITIAVSGQPIEFVVVGIVPYWPSEYPDQAPFFIANLDYIFDQSPLMPYEIWLKVKPDAKLAPMIEALKQQHIELASNPRDVRNELLAQSKHPSRGGVFGILSLGFAVSVFISLFGYALYWFFHLSGRVVQFGVLRAMGLKRRQLTGMLLLEQAFTALLSIALGIGIGKLISYLFLPFLQTDSGAAAQTPPFHVVFLARDQYPLYGTVAVMMAIGTALLLLHIRRLRVHQAVKLGEER